MGLFDKFKFERVFSLKNQIAPTVDYPAPKQIVEGTYLSAYSLPVGWNPVNLDYMFDGEDATAATFSPNGIAGKQMLLIFDFGGHYTIGTVMVNWGQDAATTTDMAVDFSRDGVNWISGAGMQSASSGVDIGLSSITGWTGIRFMRLNVIDRLGQTYSITVKHLTVTT